MRTWTRPPHVLRVTPSRPSVPSHLGFLGQKGIWGGLLLGLPWGGGTSRLLHSQPCHKSHIPITSWCNGRRGTRTTKKPPCPFPSHRRPVPGHNATRGVSPRDRQRRQGQAARLEGHKGTVLVVTVPWGWPVPGRAAREQQVSPSSLQSCRVAALLPVTEKSLRQQILLSVKMPLRRANSCVQTGPEQRGWRKSCP